VRLVIAPEITIGAIVSQRNSQEEARKAFVAHLELLKDLFELRIVLIWLTQYSNTDYSLKEMFELRVGTLGPSAIQ
jgi:hypothetical protein